MTSNLSLNRVSVDSESVLPGCLLKYPKVRPSISPELEDLFFHEYKNNRAAKGLLHCFCMWLESWMHRRVASCSPGGPILELGAGTLNHLQFEQNSKAYDVIEPFPHWYENSPNIGKVRSFFRDISEINLGEEIYSRIISVAVLEHVTDLPDCVAKAGLLLQKNGVFQAGIPSEGGLLWALAWRMSTGLSFSLRTGCDYGELMRHEHVNTADEVLDVVRCFFDSVELERFPLNHKHLSTYTYFIAREPRVQNCRRFLESRT